jgi:hypothetical protein
MLTSPKSHPVAINLLSYEKSTPLIWVPSVPEGKIPSTNHPNFAEDECQSIFLVLVAPFVSY